MSSSGYDAVVDVDADEGDLGHTDLRDDLEFHNSNFADPTPGSRKPTSSSGLPPPVTASSSSSSTTTRHIWTLRFYSQFFDVDTSTVVARCWAALYPRASFLDVLDGNPDLYGPFWIATTVVFFLFLGGTINQYVATGGKETAYDFRLLSASAGLVYGYTLFIPIVLYAALRYFGTDDANILEYWALYGYSNLTWIPVALISWSSINILNWVFVAVGFGVSVAFLLRNLYPATDRQVSKVLLVIVMALHAGLALAIKIVCFAHGSPIANHPGGDGGLNPGLDKPGR